MNANRWALARPDEPSAQPNPGAGFTVGRVHGVRPEGSMAAVPKGGKGPSDWHPTVANLAVLVVLELAAYAAARYFFRTVHGG